MHTFEPVVGLLLTFLILMAVARQVRVAPPITLVVGGLVLSFIPGLPHLALDPGLILLMFLPPVLFWEATLASWREVKHNLRPIALLAVGLVLLTMGVVAAVAHALIPGLPWAAAFVLGAVVSPTDPVALLSIAQRLPLPRQVVDVLVGESLVNDATALVAFRFALAAMATGSFVAADATGQFFYVVTAAIVIGLASAWAILQLRRFSARDTLYDNLNVFLTPFLAYLAAELCGASGVLAVVVSGLYIGRRLPELMSSQARLQGGALWEMVVFVLNGLIFVLIGLQLNVILQQPLSLPLGTLLAVGAAVTGAVILTRLLYMVPAVLAPRLLNRSLRERDPAPPLSHIALLGWTGMRGGVSLAAALAIPTVLAGGASFPGRNEIILITYMVILGTLGLQGLTLPALIRLLGVTGDEAQADEEATARLEVARSALRRLDELAIVHDVPRDMLDSLHDFYLERAERLQARLAVRPNTRLESRDQLLVLLTSEVLDAERRTLLILRAEGAIGDKVFHRLQEELDRQAVVANATASPNAIPPV